MNNPAAKNPLSQIEDRLHEIEDNILEKIDIDKRFQSGVPQDQRGTDLEFIKMSGLARSKASPASPEPISRKKIPDTVPVNANPGLTPGIETNEGGDLELLSKEIGSTSTVDLKQIIADLADDWDNSDHDDFQHDIELEKSIRELGGEFIADDDAPEDIIIENLDTIAKPTPAPLFEKRREINIPVDQKAHKNIPANKEITAVPHTKPDTLLPVKKVHTIPRKSEPQKTDKNLLTRKRKTIATRTKLGAPLPVRKSQNTPRKPELRKKDIVKVPVKDPILPIDKRKKKKTTVHNNLKRDKIVMSCIYAALILLLLFLFSGIYNWLD